MKSRGIDLTAIFICCTISAVSSNRFDVYLDEQHVGQDTLSDEIDYEIDKLDLLEFEVGNGDFDAENDMVDEYVMDSSIVDLIESSIVDHSEGDVLLHSPLGEAMGAELEDIDTQRRLLEDLSAIDEAYYNLQQKDIVTAVEAIRPKGSLRGGKD